jgi:cyclopropane fatty-acyl-phospholipid synthase-like methyltransferase
MDAMEGEYERRSPWTLMRLANVRELVDPQPGDRVLDLGCATGAMAHYVSTFGCQATGVDASEVGIARAQELFPGLDFQVGDVAALPFPDGSFDKLIAADLTEHLEEETLHGMFRESHRVLRPGGTLSIHTPNPRHLVERLKARNLLVAPNPTHIGLRTSGELERALRAEGFEIELSLWRRSHFPVLRTVESAVGRFSELGRYRLCLRARKP